MIVSTQVFVAPKSHDPSETCTDFVEFDSL